MYQFPLNATKTGNMSNELKGNTLGVSQPLYKESLQNNKHKDLGSFGFCFNITRKSLKLKRSST